MEIINSLPRKLSVVQDIEEINQKIGSTDISEIGDGTITGAIASQNETLVNLNTDLQAQEVEIYPNNVNEISEYTGDYYPALKLMHIRFLFAPVQAYSADANIATFSVGVSETRLIPIHAWGDNTKAKFMRHLISGYLKADTAIEASSGQYYVDYWIKTK